MYLTGPSKRRSLKKMERPVRFIVAHDTGNPGSTAVGNVSYYERSRDEMHASAHLFVDDLNIIECIPGLTVAPDEPPEKAWHVVYNVPTDDLLYGVDANDAAIGVEYCYGGRIDAEKAYAQYIWTLAYLCHRFSLDVKKDIVGHCILDPTRKTDPITGLAHSRRTYEQLLRDVDAEYSHCLGTAPQASDPDIRGSGTVRTLVRLNIREASNTRAKVVDTVLPGTSLSYDGWTEQGDPINANAKWYRQSDNKWFWSGGVE